MIRDRVGLSDGLSFPFWLALFGDFLGRWERNSEESFVERRCLRHEETDRAGDAAELGQAHHLGHSATDLRRAVGLQLPFEMDGIAQRLEPFLLTPSHEWRDELVKVCGAPVPRAYPVGGSRW